MAQAKVKITVEVEVKDGGEVKAKVKAATGLV